MGKCPACTEGDILEHSKGFYCSRWKLGCKFTIWKNSLEAYGQQITPQIVKELLKKNKIEKIEIILPQTKEKCIASLVLKEDKSGGVELKNLDRIENKE